jgi:hypothetical protein
MQSAHARRDSSAPDPVAIARRRLAVLAELLDERGARAEASAARNIAELLRVRHGTERAA